MGPKWRRPPVFYFSSMMAADTENLATDSSLSTHPVSVFACMVLPQAREARSQALEARPQTWEARPPQTVVARYNVAATTPVPTCSPPCRRARCRAGVEQLATPHRAELERRVAEPRACLGRQLAPSRQARLVKHRAALPVSGGLGGPPSRVICRRMAHRKPSEEWRKW